MEQGSLLLRRVNEDLGESVSDEVLLAKCPDMRSAIRECIEASGYAIKEVAFHLGINKDHLSRMVNCSDDPRHFPPEKLQKLMQVCGNLIPLRWLALSSGFGIHRLKTALEVENEKLRRDLEESQKEIATMMKLVKQIRN